MARDFADISGKQAFYLIAVIAYPIPDQLPAMMCMFAHKCLAQCLVADMLPHQSGVRGMSSLRPEWVNVRNVCNVRHADCARAGLQRP